MMMRAITAVDSVGRSGTFYWHGDGHGSFHLDRDPGSGSMYDHNKAVHLLTLTGGDVDALRDVLRWAVDLRRDPVRGAWYRTDNPGAVAFREWCEDVRLLIVGMTPA